MPGLTPLPIPPAWEPFVSGWTDWLIAAGKADSTISRRVDHLRRCARQVGIVDPREVQQDDLVAWASGHDWSQETRRSVRQSLLQFYRWMVTNGHMPSSPAEGLPSVSASPPRPRPADDTAVQTARDHADERELLMVRMADELGMRRGEIAVVHVDRDLFRDLVGYSLVVHGKGGKDRILPVPDSLARDIRRRGTGFCFPGQIDGHLSPERVGKLVSALLPNATTHQLRHRFATRAYRESQDILATQQLLGHASPATTQRYVAMADDRLRDLVNRLAS